MRPLPDLALTVSGHRVSMQRWVFTEYPRLLLFAFNPSDALIRVLSWALTEEQVLPLIYGLEQVVPGSRLFQDLVRMEQSSHAIGTDSNEA